MALRFPTGMYNAMKIVFKNFFRPNITIMYPHERWELPERARWAVEMKLDENGAHKCTGCKICEMTCPDFIIEINLTTDEDRNKHIDHWRYQRSACMMCGLCVEACPYDAIKMGHEYELAHVDPALKMIDLLTDTPAVKIQRKAPAPKPVAPAAPAEDKTAPAEAPAPKDAPAPREAPLTKGGDEDASNS